MSLREKTSELHKKAEQQEFNVRMVNGKLSKYDYLNYLRQQYSIFQQLEQGNLPHESLKRSQNIVADMIRLSDLYYVPFSSTKEYCDYLKKLTPEKLNCHIYLNYMALLFGGKMMKQNIPGRGMIFDFDNERECIESIRSLENEDWADEVNKGYEYIIKIYEQLQANSREDGL